MLRSAAVALLLAVVAKGATERWGRFEVVLQGPEAGNPFLETTLSADFSFGHRKVPVDGFYDGSGTYRVRFMPDETGEWSYTIHSNVAALNGKTGVFTCVQPGAGNHGPVGVNHIYHFAYADGTPYYPIGTTSYAWIHQGEELERQTLRTLKTAPFNKMRMCVFPKSYAFNTNEPPFYPFVRDRGNNDFTRFDPRFFRHLEERVGQLGELGIEADLILFHPYDRWGYAKMSADVDDRYLRYIVARLGSFRNVWWSMANEYDAMHEKTMADWDRFFRIVQESDPSMHLRSIHNMHGMYDHTKPWVTHVSLQSSEIEKTPTWLAEYHKPVIFDECKYEGNIPQRWGNLSGQEMVRRFWLATVYGAYAGHGETYLDAKDVLWWSKGGVLHGDSASRIAFLRKILEESGTGGLNPVDQYYLSAGKPGLFYLYYFDLNQPAEYTFNLAPGADYKADLIDPWQMTITPLEGTYSGKFKLKLPGKPYQAVRFRKSG